MGKISSFTFLFLLTSFNYSPAQSKLLDFDRHNLLPSKEERLILSKPSQNWELLFNYNIEEYTTSGNAGVVFISYSDNYNEIWISKWASDGLMILTFSHDTLLFSYSLTIEGVSNVRGMTYDGSYIYAANNTDTIKIIDPFDEELIGTLIAPFDTRYITYDPSANEGSGGFWIGNFSTDPTLIDYNGTTIRSIPFSSIGNTGIYGAAYDYFNLDGPFLWFWGQGAGAGNPQKIVQVNPSTGEFTGVEHDVIADPVVGQNQDSSLAGGLFITDAFYTDRIVLGGLLQGNPGTDILFGYDISGTIIIIGVPTVTTLSATNVTENSATLNGTVNPNGSSTTIVFEYGTTTSYGSEITAQQSPVSGSSEVNVSANVTGLQPNTTYHYRIRGTNNAGESGGQDMTFTTSAVSSVIPAVLTLSATNVTENSTTLNGTVNPNGSSTTVVFEYGTTTSYGNEITAQESPVAGSSEVNVSANLTGLQPNTTYHYRIRGTNSAGESGGADVSFTTSASTAAPAATTQNATNITSNSAVLNAVVNPNGFTTAVSFQYGTTISYGNQNGADQSPVNGTNDINVSLTISDLQPNTMYHFRVQAIGNGITVNGSDVTFTTGQEVNYPSNISLDNTFSFGTDMTKPTSYRMIGLPGTTGFPLSQLVSGTRGTDWNAYFDNGEVENYLVEFNGTPDFNFNPGKGFWVLSKNSVSINQTVNTVTLAADNTFSISIHSGWNIISNPFEKNVLWANVQNTNGLNANEVIHSYDGSSFVQSASFNSYQGYYFNNENDLTTLKIPYDFSASKIAAGKKEAGKQELKLLLFHNEEETSFIVAGIDPGAKYDFDKFDYFSPPGDFAELSINIDNKNLSTRYKNLYIDYRPEVGEGQVYDIKIKNASGKNLKLKAEGIDHFNEFEIYILDKRLNSIYNLKEKNEMEISSVHTKNDFQLLIGKPEFINSVKKDVTPTSYLLSQNYPNPFNPSTIIRYQIPDDNTLVQLKVYNLLGKEVLTLVDKIQNQGNYEVEFNGNELSSGVYFYTIKAADFSSTKKMILIR